MFLRRRFITSDATVTQVDGKGVWVWEKKVRRYVRISCSVAVDSDSNHQPIPSYPDSTHLMGATRTASPQFISFVCLFIFPFFFFGCVREFLVIDRQNERCCPYCAAYVYHFDTVWAGPQKTKTPTQEPRKKKHQKKP